MIRRLLSGLMPDTKTYLYANKAGDYASELHVRLSCVKQTMAEYVKELALTIVVHLIKASF